MSDVHSVRAGNPPLSMTGFVRAPTYSQTWRAFQQALKAPEYLFSFHRGTAAIADSSRRWQENFCREGEERKVDRDKDLKEERMHLASSNLKTLLTFPMLRVVQLSAHVGLWETYPVWMLPRFLKEGI